MSRLFRAAVAIGGPLLVAIATSVAAPLEQTIGEIALLHGGVGIDDRAAMEQANARYNLRLTFAIKGSGAYLTGTRLQVRDAQGTSRIDTVASGPWLYARLPAGDYVISATEGSQTLRQKVSIKANATREWVFRFDAPSE